MSNGEVAAGIGPIRGIGEDYHQSSGAGPYIVGAVLYVAILIDCLAFARISHPLVFSALVAFGLLSTWRWSWGAVHIVRSVIYQRLTFPRIRRQADLCPAPPELLILVTSYRIPAEITEHVYDRLFAEIANFDVRTVVAASVTDHADIAIIQQCLRRRASPCDVHFLIQSGTGKRAAMHDALLVLKEARVHREAQVILMDGDSAIGVNALQKACSVLSLRRNVGAVTTDNIPLVRGSVRSREWYRLRMAQRHILMCSMSLSGKLLVLTGRFSVFRASLALSTRFIDQIANDRIEHWRLGEIKLLTGDDKSTWFETLRAGYSMLYVPDSVVHPIEELPGKGFVEPTIALMRRWYGNMLRNSDRALALGPRRCGLFLWWSLLDQRVSMWTTIVGPTSAVVLTCLYGPSALAAYVGWVLVTRGVLSLVIGLATKRFHPAFPALLYYGQVVGSAVKIYVSFHLHQQKWNRQGIYADAPRLSDLTSALYYAGSLVIFLISFGWVWTL